MSIRHLIGADSGAVRCEIELGRSSGHSKHGNVWFAEINLNANDGSRFFARSEGESINAAIDAVKDDVLAQMRNHKKVSRGMLRKGGAYLKRLIQRG